MDDNQEQQEQQEQEDFSPKWKEAIKRVVREVLAEEGLVRPVITIRPPVTSTGIGTLGEPEIPGVPEREPEREPDSRDSIGRGGERWGQL